MSVLCIIVACTKPLFWTNNIIFWDWFITNAYTNLSIQHELLSPVKKIYFHAEYSIIIHTQFGRPALTIACEQGNMALVEMLIEKGANVKGTGEVT